MAASRFIFMEAKLCQSDIVVALADSNDEYLKASFSQHGDPLFQGLFEQQCWVLAKNGTKFSVHVGFDGPRSPYPGVGALVATVFFDGVRVSDAFITTESIEQRAKEIRGRRKKRDEMIYGATEICGSPGDDGMMSLFHFGARNATEYVIDIGHQANGNRWEHMGSLGQIRVEVRWAKLTTGLPGSMKPLYSDASKLSDEVGRKHLKRKHRLVASLAQETLDPDIKAERELEGGYRFEHQPLDDLIYVFSFHYAEKRVLQADGFMTPAQDRLES
ncbi:hypothetical protein FRC06_006510 [Ceratobasidium sp. 370]|nr:hypothetical protein FRC06_006510 [Ceratobasidium sp. 370]